MKSSYDQGYTCIECGNSYSDIDGNTDERMCNDCIDSEHEYSVTVTASFGVMAVSQEDADDYILQQFYSGNTGYTQEVEVSDE